jgi:hypothetical protein
MVVGETMVLGQLELTTMTMDRLLSAHRHLPDELPDPETLSVRTAFDLAKAHARPGRHRGFIPINTGLSYLNDAMRWVHCYGEAIVDDYLATLARLDFAGFRARKTRPDRPVLHQAFASAESAQLVVDHHGTPTLIRTALGITTFNRRSNETASFEAFRAAPTLTEALNVLIGACVVCIGLLKPSREAELTHLPRECSIEHHDGYYLRFELGKSNAGEAYQLRDKPIR